ncbi:MAG: hypothetical protein HY231_24150 [Acidobacteria bacterium]|nr:hypothetical protein [Acidobacteriota bacterium]
MIELDDKRKQVAQLLVSDDPRDHEQARRLHDEIFYGDDFAGLGLVNGLEPGLSLGQIFLIGVFAIITAIVALGLVFILVVLVVSGME